MRALQPPNQLFALAGEHRSGDDFNAAHFIAANFIAACCGWIHNAIAFVVSEKFGIPSERVCPVG